jgi:hypothetical protein
MLKPKYLWALLALPIGYLFVLVIHLIPVASGASAYLAELRGTAANSKNSTISAEYAKKVDRVIADLSIPVVKQILNTAGVNLSTIRPEIKALVSAGPTLAGAVKPQKYLISFQNSAEARGTGGNTRIRVPRAAGTVRTIAVA